jgi:uncharacterized membrane protein
MKKQNLVLLTLISFFAIATIFTSCKTDEDPPAITGEALFSYNSVGKLVTFTNESTITGTVTYLWEFGDGETSTETNPVHTYELKGEYTVTMTATDQNGKTYPVSTKVKVDKETRISLTDDSFDDWNDVVGDRYVVKVGDNSGLVVAAKFDYDATFVYAYVSWTGSIDDVFQNDYLFDTDNDSLTGAKSWLWPASGVDFLMEIAPFTGGEQVLFSAFYSGTPGADEWEWTEKELPANSFVMGTIKQEGDHVTAELGFNREKVPGLNNDVVGIGGFLSDADWAEVGFVPEKTAEGGVHQTCFILDMR